MQFSSDNWAGAAPRVQEALAALAPDPAPAYGTSLLDRAVEAAFCELFERDCHVFFVATGTAANSLAIAATSRPGGVALCHREAHVIEDECGAPEFYSGGRLAPVGGVDGRIDPQALKDALGGFVDGFVHHGRATALTLTQATEVGTVYQTGQISELAQIARGRNLAVHMDGARFANALVHLGATPAEMTWKAGVDLVSFGATKNGCWCAEALIAFDPALAEDIAFARKRAGQLFSKSRFIAAQFEAYLKDGYWLELARHSNAMAQMLADAIRQGSRMRLAWEPEANEVFAVMEKARAESLNAAGAGFYPWKVPGDWPQALSEGEDLYRLVTSFATRGLEVERFADLAARTG